jgi:hypothetical protein
MELTERELRILAEIEAGLSASDPKLAKRLSGRLGPWTNPFAPNHTPTPAGGPHRAPQPWPGLVPPRPNPPSRGYAVQPNSSDASRHPSHRRDRTSDAKALRKSALVGTWLAFALGTLLLISAISTSVHLLVVPAAVALVLTPAPYLLDVAHRRRADQHRGQQRGRGAPGADGPPAPPPACPT